MRVWSFSFSGKTFLYKVLSYCYFISSFWFRNIISLSVIMFFKFYKSTRTICHCYFFNNTNFGACLWMTKRRTRVRVMEMQFCTLPLLLFVLSLLGISINRSNIILILVCFEMMLLSIILSFLFATYFLDNNLGQIASIFIMTMAAVESAIGLSIMIVFSKLKGSVAIRFLNVLKG